MAIVYRARGAELGRWQARSGREALAFAEDSGPQCHPPGDLILARAAECILTGFDEAGFMSGIIKTLARKSALRHQGPIPLDLNWWAISLSHLYLRNRVALSITGSDLVELSSCAVSLNRLISESHEIR
jgi:hypothetical protein